MTIALDVKGLGVGARSVAPQATEPRRRRHRVLKRVLIITGSALVGLIALAAAYVGFSLYRIDHAVHHVSVPASLLAKGKNDLLAVVRGPDHSEEAYVFHQTAGHTNVLLIPGTLGVPMAAGHSVPLRSLDIHTPSTIIAGLAKLGIPVSRYVGVDLHMVDPHSNLGQLATGKLSITSLISNPTGTSSLLASVASHVYLGPGTPVSALMSLMNVPSSHPVSVPTATDGNGHVVLASAFTDVLRHFL